jgi:glycosyltransferase involved in cell wall biosynthesis
MEPITGGCHYAINCRNFTESCTSCPAVRRMFKSKITNNKIQKNKIYSQLDKLYFVFPSKWLLGNFELANSTNDLNTRVIPNPLPKIFFQESNKNNFEENYNSLTIGFVCRNLNDPIKQFKSVINAIQEFSFLTNKSLKLIAIGSKFRDLPKRLNFEVSQPGVVSNPLKMRELYAKMDLIISNSLSESFGLTIAEAAACGVPSLVLEGSGSSELILDNKTGILFKDQFHLIKKLISLAENDSLRVVMGTNAKLNSINQWHIDSITHEYDKLYEIIT